MYKGGVLMALVNRVSVTISLPKELNERVAVQAEKEHYPKGRFFEKVLSEYMERVEQENNKK